MRVRFLAPVLGVLVIAGACATPAPEDTSAAGLAAMNELRSGYAAAFKAGDAAKMASYFAADAAVMEPGMPTAIGPSAIETMLKGMFEGMTPSEITITPDKSEFGGDVGYERGTFKMTATMKADGSSMTNEGRYVVVLKRQTDGAWKLVADMGNSPIMPPATPPPPAKQN